MEQQMERMYSDEYDMSADEVVNQMREMFPHIDESVIRENTHLSHDALVTFLLDIPHNYERIRQIRMVNETVPAPVVQNRGSTVVMFDDGPILPEYRTPSTSQSTSGPSVAKKKCVTVDPALGDLRDFDMDLFNKEQLIAALENELKRRSQFVNTVKIERSRAFVTEVKQFLRDQFHDIRMPIINVLVDRLDFYSCILILKLASLNQEHKLREWKYVEPSMLPMLLPPERRDERASEAKEIRSIVPKSMAKMWGNYMELVEMDYAQPLHDMRFDCPICYETFHENQAIFCTPLMSEQMDEEKENHRFCRDCVHGHAIATTTEMAFGRGGSGVKCLMTNCKGVVLAARVRQLLTPQEMKMFDKRVDEDATAGIDGLERCQKCEFAMIIDASKEDAPVFSCQNCNSEHCRLCDRVYDQKHFGRKCGDFEKEQDEERKKLEEQLTLAVVCKCDCGLFFQKAEGCNMMTCRCGRTQCNICHAKGISHAHFSTSGCPQYSQDADLQRLHGENRQRVLENARRNEMLRAEDRDRLQ